MSGNESLRNVFTGGINFSYPGNGGPECLDYTDMDQRLWESFLGIFISIVSIGIGTQITYPIYKLVDDGDEGDRNDKRPRWCKTLLRIFSPRRILTVFLGLSFALEIGYKVITNQLIYMLNPCHVITAVQLVLLSSSASTRGMTELFRIHIHLLYMPIFAILFPATSTRLLPFEIPSFWIEHILMIVVALYLLRFTEYTAGKLKDFGWSLISYGVLGVYCYLILHPLDVATLANINFLLCPATSDPMAGPYYRLHALWHQLIPNLVLGRIFTALGR